MAKMVQVVEVFTVGGVQTTGTPQLEDLATAAGEAGSYGTIVTADQVANIAAQVGDFASLTAVTTAYNALLLALKTAGVMVDDA
ncbi:hypothetical protein D3C78_852870 [compost metagenome]